MPFDPGFIRTEINNQSYQISIHADDERLADGLTIAEVEMALGFVVEKPVHVVCGRNRSGHLVLITVYIPSMPKWKNPRTRNR